MNAVSATSVRQQRQPRVAIVGAGVSGMAMAHALSKRSIPFTVYEKASEAGGTWRDNTYPGLKCDIPFFAYCYSFRPGPHGFDRLLAPGAEIQRQFLQFVDDKKLRQHVRFNSHIVECRWSGEHWQLLTAAGETHEADVVIHATGWLHQPRYPEIPGLDAFAGPVLHTARWDASVQLSGKRVGVVGSGSTGVQIVTELGGKVGHLTSFQRTPQWILPLPDTALPPWFVNLLSKNPRIAAFVVRKFWEFNGAFVGSAATRNGWQRRAFEKAVRKHLDTVVDSDLRARLTPKDPPLCKRPVMSGDYYKVVQRPDVSVVVSAVDRVHSEGVVTKDGQLHKLDVLVLATGYDVHAYMRPMKMVGQQGMTLQAAWANGVFSYRSVGLPGFPNMFMVMGPYVSTSHIGVHEQAEAQAEYIIKAIDILSRPGVVSLTPKQTATRAWLDTVQAALSDKGRVWNGCTSYFLDTNGRPIQWPWSRKEYFAMMRTLRLDEFDVQMAGD